MTTPATDAERARALCIRLGLHGRIGGQYTEKPCEYFCPIILAAFGEVRVEARDGGMFDQLQVDTAYVRQEREKARAEGHAAGLERAAKIAESGESCADSGDCCCGGYIAEAIRAEAGKP